MGLAKVQYPRIIFNHPKFFALFGAGIILPLLWALKTQSPWWAILSLPFAIALFIYVVRLKGLFYDCDVNIGKVISGPQKLYAVAMNLNGAGQPALNAVKIARGSVPAAGQYIYKDGDYAPVICYPNYKKAPSEMDKVFTIPYSSGVSEPEKLDFQQQHITPQIEAFEQLLAKVPQPNQPGLYILN